MEKFVLNNGLTVLVEPMPYLRSVSIGAWVKAGSMLEAPGENGLSHFMEHMAFKGTGKRTARQIAEEMDRIGGQLNASTSKLCTNYFAKVIDEDLPVTFEFVTRDNLPPEVSTDRLPEDASDTIRLVRIGDYDVCPCIGRHVRSTSQIGRFEMLGTNWDEQERSFRVRFKMV